jgi:osmotically-inducible protein OsmY
MTMANDRACASVAPNHSKGVSSMRTDKEIKQDVEAELKWDPDIDATDVGIAVKGGVVALTGYISGYLQKYEAEKAAKRVAGVAGVANDLEVRLPKIDQRPDPDIARDAVEAIKSHLPISCNRIKITVGSGWITLEGEVEWNYQRETAEEAVRAIQGVKGVSNFIQLEPQARPSEIKKKIEDAFRRHAHIDANNIQIETYGGEVVLKGTVRSWIEREEAERAAWAAPGITKVDDRLTVSS